MRVFDHSHIIASCESVLDQYGDTFRGVGWTKKKEYAELRYRIMLEGIRPEWPRPLEMLDFGCGASHLLEYMRSHGFSDVHYSGLDLSEKYLSLSRGKFPETTYYNIDLVDPATSIPTYDYIVLNGLFNYRGEASHDSMWEYCRALLRRVSSFARRGFAFNVMSKYLDWERDDLFHVPFDTLASFLSTEISRSFCIRHDYGLFEYTVYVYHDTLSDLC